MKQNSPLSIAYSMLPGQESTRQGMVNPGQFPDQNFWKFDVNREVSGVDYQPGNAELSSLNYFNNDEPYQNIKNGMFDKNLPQNPIFGHTKWILNPLDQEQTNAHMFAYQAQKQTRVANNMSPVFQMRWPYFQYPTPQWVNVYQGSRTR